MTSSDLSTLCLACGFCCDGTLFRFVGLDPGERETVAARSIGVGEKKHRDVMWLPCGKLEGRCCTIYDARPQGCRRFVCTLGQRLVARELSFDDALGTVREMQARLERLRALLPPPDGTPVLRHARACIDSTTTPVTEAQLEAFRQVEALRYEAFMPPSR